MAQFNDDFLDDVTRRLMDERKAALAGWAGYLLSRRRALEYVKPDHIRDLQEAFFCGAHYIFQIMVNAMTEDDEADERRISGLHEELEAFHAQFLLRYRTPTGSA